MRGLPPDGEVKSKFADVGGRCNRTRLSLLRSRVRDGVAFYQENGKVYQRSISVQPFLEVVQVVEQHHPRTYNNERRIWPRTLLKDGTTPEFKPGDEKQLAQQSDDLLRLPLLLDHELPGCIYDAGEREIGHACTTKDWRRATTLRTISTSCAVAFMLGVDGTVTGNRRIGRRVPRVRWW